MMLLLSLALVLVACSRGSEARVRLNAIRTVILRDGHALPVNRSAWEPNLDLTLYQCMSDLECREGSYCHATTRGPAHSRCQTCRRRKRRCHRDGMCCPGNRCSNSVCVWTSETSSSSSSQSVPDSDSSLSRRDWRRRDRKEEQEEASGRGQLGDACVRSSDCSAALCCARHFWTRMCKSVLLEGQVCTRHRRKSQHGGLELFQRCPCGGGLGCRALRESRSPSSSSSSSSSLLAAAKSKFSSSSSRHASPHTSPLSSSSSSKARLHVCQRK